MVKYVIEHLEPRMWRWCLIEYKHISKLVGRKNLLFTNIKRKNKELEKYGATLKKSVKELRLNNACLLDPAAEKTLNPNEAGRFDYFIFGGILGDYPAKRRTEKMLAHFINAAVRNLGKKQMSTDNAVAVVKIIKNGIPLNKINFKQGIEIIIKKGESVCLPYRYVLINKTPLVSDELITYLRRKKSL